MKHLIAELKEAEHILKQFLSKKAKVKFDDKQFGKLLKSGDKVKIKNLMTGKEVEETVDRFDGLEYTFKGKPSPKENLGHSGYSVESPKEFTIYMNMTPHLKVTKV